MSTDFKTQKKITISDLFGDRLKKYGINGELGMSVPGLQCGHLTDGRNYLSVMSSGSGRPLLSRTAGCGDANYILGCIAEEFKTEIYSEHQPQYWGFDTEAEWDAWQKGQRVGHAAR